MEIMKTKDGRRAYGSPPECECGNPATVGNGKNKICERCDRIQKKTFTDKSYCGVFVTENAVIDKGGEAFQVHNWRVGKTKYIDRESPDFF